jgi:hypothetical protein
MATIKPQNQNLLLVQMNSTCYSFLCYYELLISLVKTAKVKSQIYILPIYKLNKRTLSSKSHILGPIVTLLFGSNCNCLL